MKRSLHNLAICGGSPAFEDERHVGRPNTGDRALFLARVNDLLDRRWLTNGGPYVEELEGRIAELHEVNHCVVTCNGTVALELSIRALELHGEVIVPAFTFVATAHALQWHGITPVFCDIDPRTHNLDPRRVEELITPRTTAILPVHLWGRPCDVEELQAIVAQHGLKLIYDAAHATPIRPHACPSASGCPTSFFPYPPEPASQPKTSTLFATSSSPRLLTGRSWSG